MVAVKAQDVMDNLLSCETGEQLPETEELDYLIYRNPDSLDADDSTETQFDHIWTASKDKVTVQICESRANIRIRVSRQSHQDISMKGIADIAVKAIIDELRRKAQ